MWVAIFACWAGMNLVLVYGPEWWSLLFNPRIKATWQARWDYKSCEWVVPLESDGAGRKLAYRLLEPLNQNHPQPLLVFLHGSGDRGDDNTTQLNSLPSQLARSEWRKICPGYILAPQCPAGTHWHNELPTLISLIDAWRNDPRIDQRRVYLTGLSMGGYGAWHLATAKPEWFAAVVPICGGGDPASAPRLTKTPIWAIHGDADEVVPVDETRTMIEAIRSAGGHPLYTELPGVGHDSWSQTYAETEGVLPWAYQQLNLGLHGGR